MPRRLLPSLCLPALLLLTSCVSSRVQVWKESPPRQKQWAEAIKAEALLSAVVYRGTNPVLIRNVPDFEAMLKKEGWRHREVCDETNGAGRGLYFEVWENTRTKPRKVVFAFRGTEVFSVVDWRSNFRWFRFINRRSPDQYDVSRQRALPLIDRYYDKAKGEKPMIIVTGHSLGGGIAEGIYYAACHKVDHCIVFDPSPVTGLYDLDEKVRARYLNLQSRTSSPQFRIIRAHQRGEFLQPIRNFLGVFYKRDALIESIEFKSEHMLSNGVIEHCMEQLAISILQAVEPPKVP